MSKKHTGKEKKAVPEDRSDEQTAESEQAADITDDVNDDAGGAGRRDGGRRDRRSGDGAAGSAENAYLVRPGGKSAAGSTYREANALRRRA